MKKINVFKTVIVVFLLSFITSCEKHECKCDCEDWQSQVPEGIYFYKDNGRPSNAIKYNEIVKMLEAYDETRKEVLKKSLGFEDTRVNSYPIEQLKDYLGYIEGLCAEKEIELTGINIISAAYPKNYSKSKEAGYQSLIFMPTTTIDGESYVTFDPLKSKKGHPVTFKSILASKGYNWTYDRSKVAKEEQKAGVITLPNMQGGFDDSSGSNKLGTSPPM